MEFPDIVVEIFERASLFDLVLVFSVPVALGLVYLLPQEVQLRWVLDYQNPQVVNMFTSAFVHRGFDHFAGNMVSYFLLVIPGYFLSILGGERRLFRFSFPVFVLLLPFILSGFNLLIIEPNSSAGFSGINAAFLGFLPVALFSFLHNRVSDSIEVSNSVSLFGVAGTTVAWIYTGVSSVTLVVALVTVLSFWIHIYRIGLTELKTNFRELYEKPGYLELVIISLLLFLVVPEAMFPKDLIQGENTVNILTHYTGLVSGFFIPYIYKTYIAS